MAMKQPGRKTYRTMQGKTIDMDLLRKKNELTPAVGNAKVNARGDILGAGGRIVKKKEDVIKEYYKRGPVGNEGFAQSKSEPVAQENTTVEKKSTTRAQKKIENKLTSEEKEIFEEFDDTWTEDDNGNFVKKGE
jgi:hypothetical protein